MAFSKNLIIEKYKNLSVAELEEKYRELEHDYYFENPEQQIENMAKYYYNASYRTNLSSTRAGLEQLLKEKTGKDYHIKEQTFQLTLADFIGYIERFCAGGSKETLTNFFNNVKPEDFKDTENFKERFLDFSKFDVLMCFIKNKVILESFLAEIKTSTSTKELFIKYTKRAKELFVQNKIIS